MHVSITPANLHVQACDIAASHALASARAREQECLHCQSAGTNHACVWLRLTAPSVSCQGRRADGQLMIHCRAVQSKSRCSSRVALRVAFLKVSRLLQAGIAGVAHPSAAMVKTLQDWARYAPTIHLPVMVSAPRQELHAPTQRNARWLHLMVALLEMVCQNVAVRLRHQNNAECTIMNWRSGTGCRRARDATTTLALPVPKRGMPEQLATTNGSSRSPRLLE